MRSKIFSSAVLIIVIVLSGCSRDTSKIPFIATNMWTAAYVEAATGETCISLAPSGSIHPPEYELNPGDFDRINRAEYIVYAGYEVMISDLKKNPDINGKMVQIKTGYNMRLMEASINIIAELAGTKKTAGESLERIRCLIDEKRIGNNGDFKKDEVIIHKFLIPLAKELNLNIAGTFGPEPLKASDIEKFAQMNPDYIIDNGNSITAEPLVEILEGSEYIIWINFPGLYGTESLEDVIRYNVSKLD